jgi:PKD repeat protein
MKKSTFLTLAFVGAISGMVMSCKKTPAPTVEIFETVDGYTVTFNPKVTNVSTYEWDFGDVEISTEAKPVHTYAVSGTKTVTLTVKGEGGEATDTKEITIDASILEMLTGGETDTDGKTWVLDQAFTEGDGGGPIMNPPYTVTIPGAEYNLESLGFDAEYDNEFTFFAHDNKFSVDPKNGIVLAGAVYGYWPPETIIGEANLDVGLCEATWTAPASATWELHTDDLVMDIIPNHGDTNVPPETAQVTITGQNWISINSQDSEAFFGIKDFPSTTQFIIDDITMDKMRVSMFLCAYSDDGGDPMYNMMPTDMIHLSYIKK